MHFLRIKGKKIQKGEIFLHCHKKTMLKAVFKINHPLCYKMILAEIFLDLLMSALQMNHKIILLHGMFITEHMGEMTKGEAYQDGRSRSSRISR